MTDLLLAVRLGDWAVCVSAGRFSGHGHCQSGLSRFVSSAPARLQVVAIGNAGGVGTLRAAGAASQGLFGVGRWR